MKILPEHYSKIVSHFKAVGAEQIAKHRAFLLSPENPRKPQDLEKRLRWDVWGSMPSLIRHPLCNAMYAAGLSDSHIDTALKAAMREMGGIATPPVETYLHVGSDFNDEHGVRWSTVQIVRKSDGFSIGDARFKDGQCYYKLAIDSINLDSFLSDAQKLVENSIPIPIDNRQPTL